MAEKIAIIRIKGEMGLNQDIRNVFKMLKLYKKNGCNVIDNTPSNVGLVNVIKYNATWGEINKETFKKLLLERGRLAGNVRLTEEYIKEKLKITMDQFIDDFFSSKRKLKDVPGLKSFFKLKPPVNGFERKGVKVPFAQGGVLGYRKDGINEILKRMI